MMRFIGVSGFAQPKRISNGILDLCNEIGAPACYYKWDQAILEPEGDGPIVLFGHSFGGHTVAKWAKAYPGEILAMLLADPVAHFQSVSRNIAISGNVQNLFSWQHWGERQTLDAPAKTKVLVDLRVRGVPHYQMDELPQFKQAVLRIASGEIKL